MKGFARNLHKINHTKSLEWAVVVAIPLIMLGAIRYMSMFYVGLSVLGAMLLYGAVALWDYNHTAHWKKRSKKAHHYGAVALYMLGSLFISILYLLG